MNVKELSEYLRANSLQGSELFVYPDRGSFWWKLNFYRGDWGRTMRWALNGFRYRRMMDRRRDRR